MFILVSCGASCVRPRFMRWKYSPSFFTHFYLFPCFCGGRALLASQSKFVTCQGKLWREKNFFDKPIPSVFPTKHFQRLCITLSSCGKHVKLPIHRKKIMCVTYAIEPRMNLLKVSLHHALYFIFIFALSYHFFYFSLNQFLSQS